MDIKKLYTRDRHNAGSEVRVKDELGNDTDMYIRVVGMDSNAWNSIQLSIGRDHADGKEIETHEILADATIGWRGVESDGVELEFSRDLVRDLYFSAPYIAEQVNRFIGNRRNFTQPT
jgi:hypothetical protein